MAIPSPNNLLWLLRGRLWLWLWVLPGRGPRRPFPPQLVHEPEQRRHKHARPALREAGLSLCSSSVIK